MMKRAGFSACPADAAPGGAAPRRVVLKNAGGRGAAREFIEHILRYNKLAERAAATARTRAIVIK